MSDQEEEKEDEVLAAASGVHIAGRGQLTDEQVNRIIENNRKIFREIREDIERALMNKNCKAYRSPWASGSFYLVAVIVVLLTFRVLVGAANVWMLPAFVIGGVLLCTIIGAFQIRQDERFSEEGFLKLMALVFARLPVIRMFQRTPKRPNDHQKSNGSSGGQI